MVTRFFRWLRAHPYVIGFAIMGTLFTITIGIDRQQDARERREDELEIVTAVEHDARNTCAAANESRRLIREIGVQLAMANAEALIAVVPDVDPAVVEAFRVATRINAEETVAALGPRDCVEEVREAREEAAEIQGVDLG